MLAWKEAYFSFRVSLLHLQRRWRDKFSPSAKVMKQNMLTALFAGRKMSVKGFYELLEASCPKEEWKKYEVFAYGQALCEWQELPKYYQAFLTNLICHNRQPFLDYLLENTVMSALRYPLQQKEMLRKLVNLMEGNKRDYKPSFEALAFACQLGFKSDLKISTLGDYIRKSKLDTEEILNLCGLVEIHNIDGDLGEKEQGKRIVR